MGRPPPPKPAVPAAASALAERAAEIFAQKGFAATSVREIAEAAGVTKPMLYYYFGSKEGLIAHIVGRAHRAHLDVVDDVLARALPIEEALAAVLRAHLGFAEQNPATVELMSRLHFTPPDEIGVDVVQLKLEWHRATRELFERAVQRGELPPRDPDLLAIAFAGHVAMNVIARVRCPPGIQWGPPADAVLAVVDLFLSGARHPGARSSHA